MIVSASCLNAINFWEDQSQESFMWVGAGPGTMDSPNASLLGMNTSINYLKSDHIFKLRGIYTEEMVLYGPKPNDEIWELGLLYGRRTAGGKTGVSILAGISYTGGTYKGDRLDTDPFSEDYEELTFETVGLPIELQFDVNLLKFVGFSIMFFTDINPHTIYTGVNFSILIGYLPGNFDL